jgi:hypothetical protein
VRHGKVTQGGKAKRRNLWLRDPGRAAETQKALTDKTPEERCPDYPGPDGQLADLPRLRAERQEWVRRWVKKKRVIAGPSHYRRTR